MSKRNLKRIKATSPSAVKLRTELRERAMPEVKKLVKRFDRQTVNWCVQQLAEYERKIKKLNEAKKEVEKMEQELD